MAARRIGKKSVDQLRKKAEEVVRTVMGGGISFRQAMRELQAVIDGKFIPRAQKTDDRDFFESG